MKVNLFTYTIIILVLGHLFTIAIIMRLRYVPLNRKSTVFMPRILPNKKNYGKCVSGQ